MPELKKLNLQKFEDPEANPVALAEGVNPDEYIIATYLMSFPADFSAYKVTQLLAIEQSTGTWTPVPGETPEVRKEHVGKVIGVYEYPDYSIMLPPDTDWRNYFVQIAFPEDNIGEQISGLFTTVIGNISAGFGKVRLLDVRFPKKYVEGFKGPKFGIPGIRDVLGVYDRPLLNNMIKPCVYGPAKLGAKYAYEVAKGGVDIIKDDELLFNRPFNPIEERVTLFMEAIDKAYEETGEKTLYAVEVTDDIPRIFENIDTALEHGANCLLVNYIAAGWSVLRKIAEDPSVNVPILAHSDVSGVYIASHEYGINASLVLGKFPRLLGADIVLVGAPGGKVQFLEDKGWPIIDVLRYPFYHIKPVFPMASGGVYPSLVPSLIAGAGKDIIIGAGGGIHAHPMGPEAGAKAFRQAIDIVLKEGITSVRELRKYAKENNVKELLTALETWKF